MSLSITEAFYQLRRAVNGPEVSSDVGNESLDTIHAAMESLKAANVALEAEVVRLKGVNEQLVKDVEAFKNRQIALLAEVKEGA